MRIFLFRSQSRDSLCAFAADSTGSRLPEKFGPWRCVGVVRQGAPLPHNVPRPAVESAILGEGFQLYRLKAKTTT